MEDTSSRPSREGSSSSSRPPSIAVLPTITEVPDNASLPGPAMASASSTPRGQYRRSRAAPSIESEQAAFSFLAYPSDWTPFDLAFREMCTNLKITNYIFGTLPFPRQTIELIVPYTVNHVLDDDFMFSSLSEYEEQIEDRFRNCDVGMEVALEELEEFNTAPCRPHHRTYKQFLEVRKGVEELRCWLVEHVSQPLMERCLPGIGDGLKGQDPRKWYTNLARLVEFWRQQAKFRIRYLAQWCRLLEYNNVTTRRALLGWVKQLTRYIEDGLEYRVEEVMDFEVVFMKHLVGFGVVKTAFMHTPGGEQKFVDDVTSEIMLEKLHWESAMKEIRTPLEKSITQGQGDETVSFGPKKRESREEFQRMKEDLDTLVRVDKARGLAGYAVRSSHLIPDMDSIPQEWRGPRNPMVTEVAEKRYSRFFGQTHLLNGDMSNLKEAEAADKNEDEDSNSLRVEVDNTEYGYMPKLERQQPEQPSRMRDKVKNWAQNLGPVKRLRSLFPSKAAET